MKDKPENPPAFPNNVVNAQGMSLRDYFAAKAMQALLGDYEDCGHYSNFAARSYLIADAMLAERSKSDE